MANSFCKNCGREIIKGNFCVGCGTPLDVNTQNIKPKKTLGCGTLLLIFLIVWVVGIGGALISTNILNKSMVNTYNGGNSNDASITKAEYDAVNNGMSYQEVVSVIGSSGNCISEVGAKGSPYYTVIYSWYGEGMAGANANFTFQNNKLMAKSQIGLQ